MDGSPHLSQLTDPILTDRTIPARLSGLVADLELDQPRIVALDEIASKARSRGLAASPRNLAWRLTQHGWLIPLRTKGMYEFVPAARAGVVSSGDPFVELRATLKRRPTLPVAVAEDSASWLHGFSTRTPDRHVLALPPSVAPPQALSDCRTVHFDTQLDPMVIDGLPVWRPETLLVMMAARPTAYGDWNNVLDWLPKAIDRSDSSLIDRELGGQPATVVARLAYLFDRADRANRLTPLMRRGHRPEGPVYFGNARRGGSYYRRFNVVDSLLPEVTPSGNTNY